MEEFQLLTLDGYADQAGRTDQHSDGNSLNFPLLGLFVSHETARRRILRPASQAHHRAASRSGSDWIDQ